MATEESRALVRRMFEQGVIAGDGEAFRGAYAPDLIYHNPVVRALPSVPPGPGGMWQLVIAMRTAFPDLRYTIEALIAEGDRVAVLYSWRGTHRGELAGLPPTGRAVTATGAIVCRVAGGRIVEQWDVDDRLDVAQQLGLVPAPGQAVA